MSGEKQLLTESKMYKLSCKLRGEAQCEGLERGKGKQKEENVSDLVIMAGLREEKVIR